MKKASKRCCCEPTQPSASQFLTSLPCDVLEKILLGAVDQNGSIKPRSRCDTCGRRHQNFCDFNKLINSLLLVSKNWHEAIRLFLPTVRSSFVIHTLHRSLSAEEQELGRKVSCLNITDVSEVEFDELCEAIVANQNLHYISCVTLHLDSSMQNNYRQRRLRDLMEKLKRCKYVSVLALTLPDVMDDTFSQNELEHFKITVIRDDCMLPDPGRRSVFNLSGSAHSLKSLIVFAAGRFKGTFPHLSQFRTLEHVRLAGVRAAPPAHTALQGLNALRTMGISATMLNQHHLDCILKMKNLTRLLLIVDLHDRQEVMGIMTTNYFLDEILCRSSKASDAFSMHFVLSYKQTSVSQTDEFSIFVENLTRHFGGKLSYSFNQPANFLIGFDSD